MPVSHADSVTSFGAPEVQARRLERGEDAALVHVVGQVRAGEREAGTQQRIAAA